MAKKEEFSDLVQASFSTLVMSIGSSAAMSLGLVPHPQTGEHEKDLTIAKFNIDLLNVLQEKTIHNLTKEEDEFLKRLTADLQMKFVELTKEEASKK